MSEQVKRYDPEAIETRGSSRVMAVMTEDAQGDWVRAEDYDALHAENKALKHALDVKEEFYQDALHSHIVLAQQRDQLRAELEALRSQLETARGLLGEIRPMAAKSPASDWFARRYSLLTATPAPEVLSQHAERQEAVVLTVGAYYTSTRGFGSMLYLGETHDIDGWLPTFRASNGKTKVYRLEDLHTAFAEFERKPAPPAQDVSGLVELLRDIAPFFVAPFGRDDLHKRIDEALAAYRKAQP